MSTHIDRLALLDDEQPVPLGGRRPASSDAAVPDTSQAGPVDPQPRVATSRASRRRPGRVAGRRSRRPATSARNGCCARSPSHHQRGSAAPCSD